MLPADLGDPAAIEALLKSAEAALGGIDILVNNAGLTRDNLAMRMKDEDWQKVIDVNLTAGFRLARGGDARHDEAALGPHHRHHLGGRRDRQSRARPTTRPPRPA